MKQKILFLVPYSPNEAASQRFRFEQYLQILHTRNFETDIHSFFEENHDQLFFKNQTFFRSISTIAKGIVKRLAILPKVQSYDFIFIHREIVPVGPAIIEWIIAKVLRKKIIYDFDDAIWITDKPNEGNMASLVRCRGKIKYICKWSYRVSCGNIYLAKYALRFNTNVTINPTTIDIANTELLPQAETGKKIVIGWTGSQSTLKYLSIIEKVLIEIETNYRNVEILVIANQRPRLRLKTLRFIPWRIKSELSDLSQISIGIMPLPDDEWTRGKCGFKALQYMALGIPCIASPVGVNKEIISDGVNGLLAVDHKDWYKKLELLIDDVDLQNRLKENGKKTVRDRYSKESNAANFLSLFT